MIRCHQCYKHFTAEEMGTNPRTGKTYSRCQKCRERRNELAVARRAGRPRKRQSYLTQCERCENIEACREIVKTLAPLPCQVEGGVPEAWVLPVYLVGGD